MIRVIEIHKILYVIERRCKMAKTRHVTPKGDKWQVIKGGSSRASSLHNTQTDAIKQATSTAKRNKEELSIHNKKGEIRDKRSYGNDPCPPIDKR